MSEESMVTWKVNTTVFEEGPNQPPVKMVFQDVVTWKVTDDNTLVVVGADYRFVAPPGMWVAVFARIQPAKTE